MLKKMCARELRDITLRICILCTRHNILSRGRYAVPSAQYVYRVEISPRSLIRCFQSTSFCFACEFHHMIRDTHCLLRVNLQTRLRCAIINLQTRLRRAIINLQLREINDLYISIDTCPRCN